MMNNTELELSMAIRRNLTIKNLSSIISDIVVELETNPNLVACSGNFEDIQTLLDCILDESLMNESSLSSVQEHYENSKIGGVA